MMKKLMTTAFLLMVTMQLFAQGEGSAVADTLAVWPLFYLDYWHFCFQLNEE
jgi:hypothetical protein